VRSRPHALHVEAPQTPDRLWHSIFNTMLSVPRVPPSASQLWACGIASSDRGGSGPLRHAKHIQLLFLLFHRVGCSRSRIRGPLSSFPVPTGHSLVVHLCTSPTEPQTASSKPRARRRVLAGRWAKPPFRPVAFQTSLSRLGSGELHLSELCNRCKYSD
jgi:hypothetical protein